MLKVIFLVLAVSLVQSCTNTSDTAESNKKRIDIAPPEPDKDLREKYEAHQKWKQLECKFTDPDTSLSGIILRNANTTTSVIGDTDNYHQDEVYHYYSKDFNETLSLIQHPGDGKYNISIFRVQLSAKSQKEYRPLKVNKFRTEKGIELGLSKQQIIDKLGKCYITKDSTKEHIELYYRIEEPNDSKTKLLRNQNMPVYYASYILRNDKLQKFEFGFEYP